MDADVHAYLPWGARQGSHVRHVRENEKGHTQPECIRVLVEEHGADRISQSAFSRLENGKTKRPSAAIINALVAYCADRAPLEPNVDPSTKDRVVPGHPLDRLANEMNVDPLRAALVEGVVHRLTSTAGNFTEWDWKALELIWPFA